MSPRRLVIRWRQYDEAGAIVREYVEAEEYERIEAALSRYADHDRACDARENALYACTCGFVEMVEHVFPSKEVAPIQTDP